MTLLSDTPIPLRQGNHSHRLIPVVDTSGGHRETVGWMCRNVLCGQSWDELPPIDERLIGCPGD